MAQGREETRGEEGGPRGEGSTAQPGRGRGEGMRGRQEQVEGGESGPRELDSTARPSETGANRRLPSAAWAGLRAPFNNVSHKMTCYVWTKCLLTTS